MSESAKPMLRRVFVGGLFPDIEESDINERFSKFGSVESVDIKVKRNCEETNTFAFVLLESTAANLSKCISQYNNTRWKGHQMKISVAKESFLSRLEKEREEKPVGETNGFPNANFEPLVPRCSTQDDPATTALNVSSKSTAKPDKSMKPRKRERKPSSSDSECHSPDANVGAVKFRGIGTSFDGQNGGGNRLEKFDKDDVSINSRPSIGNASILPLSSSSKKRLSNRNRSESFDRKLATEQTKKIVIGMDQNKSPSCPESLSIRGKSKTREFDYVNERLSQKKIAETSALDRLEKFSDVWNDDDGRSLNSRSSIGNRSVAASGSISKKELSNKKRLESINQKITTQNAQQDIIRKALHDIGTPKNKIVFNRDEDDNESRAIRTKTKEKAASSTSSSMALFNDDVDDEFPADDIRVQFRLRPQFEGSSGAKLMELQNSFGHDERFKMDERFLENNEDERNDDSEQDGHAQDSESKLHAEKARNICVLQSVLGYDVCNGNNAPERCKNSARREMKYQRYDPTNRRAADLEVHVQKKAEPEDEQKKTRIPEQNAPEVSEKKFYEVSSSLQSMFHARNAGNECFSFMKTLGRDYENKHNENDVQRKQEYKCEPLIGPGSYLSKNPFKVVDSSDDEDQEPEAKHDSQTTKSEIKTSLDEKLEIWQTFFFSETDPRLREGVESFKRQEDMAIIHEKWMRQRVDLKRLFRTEQKRTIKKKKIAKFPNKGKKKIPPKVPSKMTRKTMKRR